MNRTSRTVEEKKLFKIYIQLVENRTYFDQSRFGITLLLEIEIISRDRNYFNPVLTNKLKLKFNTYGRR